MDLLYLAFRLYYTNIRFSLLFYCLLRMDVVFDHNSLIHSVVTYTGIICLQYASAICKQNYSYDYNENNLQAWDLCNILLEDQP